ncbi:MAG TPA: formate dehydrogenase [Sulfurimonas sp. UBA12504]|nr:MAG: formate dehydrogenase [Sulfurimonas sp. GWF2_37_8]DAB29165.1 MAG TPA: formate dehydrogenase [Sulfurimonas sp. UBA12504]
MSKVYFSTWNGELINNIGKPEHEWEESAYNLPAQYDDHRDSKAFIGWDGVSLFNADVDVIRLAMEYAAQYQEYSEACGRCAPGRWGGRILYDLLDKIARGEGSVADLDHLKEVGKSMQLTSKCEIGKTVPNPIIDLMVHFEGEFMACINEQKASKHYNDSIGYIAKITAPCTDACPAHVDIPAYIEGVRDLRFDDSLEATRQTMPLAHVCGRVCPHPCEDACRRTNLDEPIAIMALKRLGADWETDHGYDFFHPMEKKSMSGKRVAVVGAGPAGLTTAYYLAAEGVAVDVYEELPVLGGEVTVGVPQYRMPWEKYLQDIECVRDMGVNFILNHRVSADEMREFETSYDATMIASGTRISKKVYCDNERAEIKGYWGAIDFLDWVNLYEKFDIKTPQRVQEQQMLPTDYVNLTGKTVACVGGGFTSMDVVRCAIRAGAKKVVMIYRRDEQTIIRNTTYEEYHEAVEEGVEFYFHSAVAEMKDENNVLKSLIIDKFELVPPADGGRAELVKIEGASYELEVDYLVPAVSQAADLKFIPSEWELEMTSWGTLKTNGKDYMTSRKGIFASGDCEYGPMTIVNAVGQAKRGASVMARYLQNGEITLSDDEIMEDHLRKLKVYNKKEKISGWLPGLARQHSEVLDVDIRKFNNMEVNLGFTQDEAMSEADRCMRCYYIAMVQA